MTISRSEHLRRWATGVVGAAIVSALYVRYDHKAVEVATVVIALAAYFEYLRILMSPANSPAFRTLKICIGLVSATVFLLPLDFSLFFAFGLLLLCTLAIYHFHEDKPEPVRAHHFHLDDLFATAFGLFYIVGFLSFLPRIHQLAAGPVWFLGLIGMIWAGDIAAYYGGHLLGRHKLSPTISPGKTLEGSAFGIAASIAVACAMHYYWLPTIIIEKFILLGFFTSVVSQLGDLFESLLKRAVGVKDSGYFLPGHGGMLDRFDSLILAAPFYYLLLRYTIVY